MRASTFVVALAALGGLAGCRRPATVARATEAASTSGPASAGVPASTSPAAASVPASANVPATASARPSPSVADAASVPRIVDWRDRPAVDRLATDCAWAPAAGDFPGPLACAHALYAQSCSANPCYDQDQKDCKPACENACTATSSSCRTTCDACKKGCADDACKRACATKTAACLEEALLAKDRCANGTCTQRYLACWTKLSADWKAHESACEKGCKAHEGCVFDCNNGGTGADACRAKCMKKFVAVCPEQLAQMCAFNGRGPSDDD